MVLSKGLIALYVTCMAIAGVRPDGEVPPIATQVPVVTEAPAATEQLVASAEPVPTQAPATDAILYMEVTQAPESLEYGSTPEPTLFTVTLTRVSGAQETVYPEAVAADTSGLGMRTVTLTYQGFSTTTSVQVIPRKVTNMKLGGGTTSSVKVSWDRLDEASRYELELKTSADATYTAVTTTTETAYEFTGLTQGQVSYVHIRAIADTTDPATGAPVTMQGAFSDDFGIAPKPDDFSGELKVTKMARTSITLKWDAVPGALAYAVYYRMPNEEKFTYEGETEEAGKYKMVGLSGGYDYIVKVIPFALQESNAGAASPEVTTGTAPTLPTVTARGGDTAIRVEFKGGRGAADYKLYYSESENGEYNLASTINTPVEFKVRSIRDLENDTAYFVKMTAERTVMGQVLVSECEPQKIVTKEASPTSTKPKLYKTKKKLKKAPACKNYKVFKKTFDYAQSFPMPGLINTNAGGFNSTSMVPQSIATYENHILIASYDLSKASDSVIYVVDGDDKSLETLILLPHKGHVGGIACDGTNIWLAYGKKMQCFPCSVVEGAIESGDDFIELYSFTNTVQTEETISYITFYKDRIWAGAYDELHSANVYIYRVDDKEVKPNLVCTGKMMMPDRTQGLCFSSKGEMIVSRSCQTNKYQRGFMSKIEIYKPSMNVNATMSRGAVKTYLLTPPMNEGIMVSGAYAYVVFESASFSGCEAPMDRVIAFKTSKLVKVKKPKA